MSRVKRCSPRSADVVTEEPPPPSLLPPPEGLAKAPVADRETLARIERVRAALPSPAPALCGTRYGHARVDGLVE